MRQQRLRNCREHERLWRDRCVDKNLKGEWLERLNALRSFDLISICEGHPNGRPYSSRSLPHINLRLKPDLIVALADDWHAYQPRVQEGISNVFRHALTSTILELRYRYSTRGERSHYREDTVLKLEVLRESSSRSEELNRDEWFLANIRASEEFDKFIGDLLVPR